MTDLDRFARQLDRAPDQLIRRGEETISDIADDIAGEMERLAPRRTGRLARSIRASGGVISVGAEYGPFQEYGTAHNPPRPFARPAMRRHTPELVEELLEDGIEAIIR